MSLSLFDLTHKVVIVTGGARGLGRVLAQGLAVQGASVVVADVDAHGAHEKRLSFQYTRIGKMSSRSSSPL